ncbi:SDR family oxidoreductase [Haloarchaeobius sp. HME9146]|uniref:SDR family oxidoreductase n=1 Tax=Haloarchaeobius sp. HME9146 TaxID=2978732 RepID=UPI0021BF97F0|nr:SDR family oxidoreductase [Haloarchaeobius sp. HME9146]MCT9096606.1 SDR family oxidoreductase [Haloarchaeobius sp. HME9146]
MNPAELTVLVAGASGGTGRELLDVLLDAGIRVRALTRSPQTVETLRIQGADEVVVGDLLYPDDAAMAVEGVDAVVCAVGTAPGPKLFFGGDLVDGEGVINLVDAAAEAGVERFVYESSIGVGTSEPKMPFPFRLLLGRVLDAKDRSERHLRQSGLAYTILRPGGLTNAPARGDVLVGEGGDTVSGTIPRRDVAEIMAAALFTPESENRTFEIVSRRGARGTPRRLVDIDWQVPQPTFVQK